MHFLSVIDRVYINISNMYNEHNINMDIDHLINEVAKANPNGDVLPLFDQETQKIFKGRTKRFIVKKVKAFVIDLFEVDSDENMANFASIRQLEKLIKISSSDNKRISCYGLVYLYIIYTLLEGKSVAAEQCSTYVRFLHKIVLDYLKDNPDDNLAFFFQGCYRPIINAINAHNCCLDNHLLPPRPRKHPLDACE